MRLPLRDRQVYGAGAAACAVPLLRGPAADRAGDAGAAATVATFVLAGAVFGLVVAAAAVVAVGRQRRRCRPATCAPRPARVELTTPRRRPGA